MTIVIDMFSFEKILRIIDEVMGLIGRDLEYVPQRSWSMNLGNGFLSCNFHDIRDSFANTESDFPLEPIAKSEGGV